ncbi:hypothetical protein EOM86_13190 [Candidatus Nomurabacteria bacterium]|nr:hypothetical protein [Candidatus Nomurabacteria bacterium]
MYNKDISKLANETVKRISEVIPLAGITVTRHDTSAGYSAYIMISYQRANMFVSAKLRISDHSVGCFRMQTDGCMYASDREQCERFVAKASEAIDGLAKRDERIVWLRMSRKAIAEVDIDEYEELREVESEYMARRKSDGVLVRLRKVNKLI